MHKITPFLLMAISALVVVGCSSGTNNPAKVALAQCLTEKGAIMYGTTRCSHCNAQKEAFGYEAFAQIKFIDCDKNKNMCDLAGVEGYPTWVFADKSKLVGEQSLEALSSQAGCTLSTTTPIDSSIITGQTNTITEN